MNFRGRMIYFCTLNKNSTPSGAVSYTHLSQLCHAIAVSLMYANDNSSLCEYTGDSFRDLTRICLLYTSRCV